MALNNILFEVRLFKNEADRKKSQKRLLVLLEGLIDLNVLYLLENPGTVPLYQSGVKYALPEQMTENPEIEILRARNKGDDIALGAIEALASKTAGEHFRDIPTLYENGEGDCDNVASARVAELRVHGVKAKSYLTWRDRPGGGTTYHNIVLWPDGGSEDPSRILGMGGNEPDAVAARKEELRKLAERAQTMRLSKRLTTVLGHGGRGRGGHFGGRGRGRGWGGGYPVPVAYPVFIDDLEEDETVPSSLFLARRRGLL